MWPWYCYVIAAIFILSITIGIPFYDYCISLKEYKEKEKMKKKSVLDMMLDGWCDGCDGDPAACYECGKCMSEDKEDEDEEKSV